MSLFKTSPPSSQLNNEEENSQIFQLQTTPTSIKRPRLMSKPVKNVRFADISNEIPRNSPATPINSFSSDEINEMDVHSKEQPANESNRKNTDRFVQIANFSKLSPRKNAPENASTSLRAVDTTPRPPIIASDSSESTLRTPSPLTPRRSALKRKAQDLDYEPSAQIAYRSPSLSSIRRSQIASGTHRFTLSDSNIESSVDECLFPSLLKCTDNITKLCFSLAEMSRTSLLARSLHQNGVTNIGQFASLTQTSLEQIPYLKKPKYENAMNYLKNYVPVHFEQSTIPVETTDELVVPKEEMADKSLSPEHGIPLAEETIQDPISSNLLQNISEENQVTQNEENLEHVDNIQIVQNPQEVEVTTISTNEFVLPESQSNEFVLPESQSNQSDSPIEIINQILPITENDSVMEIDQTLQPLPVEQASMAIQASPWPTVRTMEMGTSPWNLRTMDMGTNPMTPLALEQTIENSISEVSSSQVGNVLKKRIADLSKLVNDAFSTTAKPKLTALESIRELHANFDNENLNKEECNEMMTLLLNLAKMTHDKGASLE